MISLDFMNSSTLHNSTDLLQPFKTMTFLQPLNAVSSVDDTLLHARNSLHPKIQASF